MGLLRDIVNFNGRQSLEYPPQHEGDTPEEYIITGKKNPLPTGNYIQNASGIWLPQTGENGAADTRIRNDETDPVVTKVTGSKVKLAEAVDIEVEAGGSEDIVGYTNVKSFTRLFGGFFLSGGGDYEVRFYGYGENTEYSPMGDVRVNSGGSNGVTIATSEVFSYFRARIYNNELEAKQYRCEIWGEK